MKSGGLSRVMMKRSKKKKGSMFHVKQKTWILVDNLWTKSHFKPFFPSVFDGKHQITLIYS